MIKWFLLGFLVLYLVPICVSYVLFRLHDSGEAWMTADRSSAGLLPDPASHPEAVVRVLSAQTVRWKGAFATHAWIVLKPEGARTYTRYDYTAWGDPIRINGFEPDGRWFGRVPDVVFAADGPGAARMIAPIQAAIAGYAHRNRGDYRAWPGPNSNTFVAAVMDAVPEMRAALPSTAIGKDYPYDGAWFRRTATGLRLTLGGYVGLTVGWIEGIELNILGAVAGLDIRHPGLKLPGLGRFGTA